MLRSVASKAMWVGQTTAAVVGLAIALALVLGAATMALAAVPGDPFKLGQINTINAVTQLVGNRNGPMLLVDNNSTGDGASALNLQVDRGNAPIRVNANSGTATGLSADRLDGLEPSQIKGAKAYALVDPNEGPGATPALLPNQTSGFISVERTGTGDYCLTAPGLSPESRPAEVSVEWYTTSPPEANAAAMFNSRNVCPNRQFAVRTERTVLSAGTLRDADADDVGFVIAVP